jgi:hypothetical protein
MDFELKSLPITQCVFLLCFAAGIFMDKWEPLLIFLGVSLVYWFVKSTLRVEKVEKK